MSVSPPFRLTCCSYEPQKFLFTYTSARHFKTFNTHTQPSGFLSLDRFA